MWRPLIEPFAPGQHLSASRQMEPMRKAVLASCNLSGSGLAVSTGPTGVLLKMAKRGLLAMFQLTEAVQWPDSTRASGGNQTEADVAWSDNAALVWYEPWDSDAAGNVYAEQSTNQQVYTIYFPLTDRNTNGLAVDYTNLQIDDRVWCYFSRQSGRWESLDYVNGPRKFRYGKLDGALAAGGSATVSLWRDSTTELWDGWDEDSGDNVTAHAPPVLSSGSIDSGKWVIVERLGSKWVVTHAEC